MTTEADSAEEWEEDDKAMFEMAERKWRHIIGHECGHATASLANGQCPDAVQIGQLVDMNTGTVHNGLTMNGGLPDTASAEAKATVLLAGMAAEELLFESHASGAERDLDQLKPIIKDIMGRSGESRNAAEIQADLMDRTKSLLQANYEVLEKLYEESVKSAEEFGFVKLNEKGSAMMLLTDELLQDVWNELKPKT